MYKFKSVVLSVILVFCFCLSSTLVFANQNSVDEVFNGAVVDATDTITSRILSVGSKNEFGIWYEADLLLGLMPAEKNAELEIVLEQSWDKTSANFVADTSSTIAPITATEASVVTVSPNPMKYMRFKVIGGANNATNTTITMKLFTRET